MKYKDLVQCETWPQARDRLMAGSRPLAVARWMQAQGDYLDVKPESLARVLRRWLDDEAQDYPARIVPAPIMERAIESVEQKVSILDNLLDALSWQKRRVESALSFESNLPMPVETVRYEMDLYFKMLRQALQAMQSLGLSPKVPEQLQVLVGMVSAPGQLSGGPGHQDDKAAALISMLDSVDDKKAVWGQVLALDRALKSGQSIDSE